MTLALAFPARDEAGCIGRTLDSFRDAVDFAVVGVDLRSADATKDEAEKHGAATFDLPWDDYAQARNACVAEAKARGADWVICPDAHEVLVAGHQELRRLDQVPLNVGALNIWRTREAEQQGWFAPMLFRTVDGARYERPVHEFLRVPDWMVVVDAPQIITQHIEAELSSGEKRERKARRLRELQQAVASTQDPWLKFELANEVGSIDSNRAAQLYRDALHVLGAEDRYQVRLHFAALLLRQLEADPSVGQVIIDILGAATMEDPRRIEHWLMLGAVWKMAGRKETALRFYEYACAGIGQLPQTNHAIQAFCYGAYPALRRAEVLFEMGRADEARVWAQKAAELGSGGLKTGADGLLQRIGVAA